MSRLLPLFLVFVAAAARAQTPVPGFELERIRLNPGASQGLLLESADLLPRLRYRVALTLHYEHAPLVLVETGPAQRVVSALVAGRWTAHLSGAFAPTDWLEVGAQLPVVLAQPGDANPPLGLAPVASGASVGTGYLHARAALFQQRRGSPLDLSLGVALGLPFGTPEALTSERSVTAVPTVGLGRTLNGFLRAGGSLSVLVRPARSLAPPRAADANSEVGSFFSVGAGLSTLGRGLRGELSGRFDVPFTPSPLSGELHLGVRYPLFERFEVYALGGPGFGGQPGTPAFRVLVGFAFAPPEEPVKIVAPPPPPRCVASQPYVLAECPRLDFDGDGVANGDDACPEDMGLAAKQGCPERDTDGDGLLDSDDACPTVPGPLELRGCRPPDADGDGVPDARDACPSSPAPKSLRGCVDADGDGLDELDDACPAVAGVVELKGCPDVDSDGDGVVDRLDACKNGKGARANQGCPETEKLLVVITRDRLVIRDKVYFATGKAVVLPQSFTLLTQIGRILQEHPEVERVSIEGHTDSQGKREANLKLSEARARAVAAFLLKTGIATERMTAKGFGPDRPVESNQTARGREANRRVDFVIVGAEKPVPAQ